MELSVRPAALRLPGARAALVNSGVCVRPGPPQVADWVENEIGLPQYRICFEANNFHGGRLLARALLPPILVLGRRRRRVSAADLVLGLPPRTL